METFTSLVQQLPSRLGALFESNRQHQQQQRQRQQQRLRRRRRRHRRRSGSDAVDAQMAARFPPLDHEPRLLSAPSLAIGGKFAPQIVVDAPPPPYRSVAASTVEHHLAVGGSGDDFCWSSGNSCASSKNGGGGIRHSWADEPPLGAKIVPPIASSTCSAQSTNIGVEPLKSRHAPLAYASGSLFSELVSVRSV